MFEISLVCSRHGSVLSSVTLLGALAQYSRKEIIALNLLAHFVERETLGEQEGLQHWVRELESARLASTGRVSALSSGHYTVLVYGQQVFIQDNAFEEEQIIVSIDEVLNLFLAMSSLLIESEAHEIVHKIQVLFSGQEADDMAESWYGTD